MSHVRWAGGGGAVVLGGGRGGSPCVVALTNCLTAEREAIFLTVVWFYCAHQA